METLQYRSADQRMRDTIAKVINSQVSSYSLDAGMDKADVIMEMLGRSPLNQEKQMVLPKIGELHLQSPKKNCDLLLAIANVSRLLAQRADAVDRLLEGRHDMASEKTFQQYIDHINNDIKTILAL